MWNDKFEFDGFYSLSDVQDYIEYTIKEHEILTKIPSVYVYINRIGNIFVFEIKSGYKLELQTRKVRKLFRNTKK